MRLNLKKIEVQMKIVPENSIVMINIPEWDDNFMSNRKNIITMLEVLNRVGESREIKFVYTPVTELTVIKKEEN